MLLTFVKFRPCCSICKAAKTKNRTQCYKTPLILLFTVNNMINNNLLMKHMVFLSFVWNGPNQSLAKGLFIWRRVVPSRRVTLLTEPPWRQNFSYISIWISGNRLHEKALPAIRRPFYLRGRFFFFFRGEKERLIQLLDYSSAAPQLK